LLPKDAEGRAHVRAFTRFHDLYLEPPRAPPAKTFGQKLDDKFVEEKVAEINSRPISLKRTLAVRAAGSTFYCRRCPAPTLFMTNPPDLTLLSRRRASQDYCVVGSCAGTTFGEESARRTALTAMMKNNDKKCNCRSACLAIPGGL
jgi:hypothetical protein